MISIVWRRVAAFFIDYCVIALYATVLFVVTMMVMKILHADLSQVQPVRGQVAGFLTLTLPVFLYFFLYEKGKMKGTPGKNMMGLQVTMVGAHHWPLSVLKRNILKLLPWEIAHAGVHWLAYYTSNNQSTPTWVFVLLILPQVVVVIYFTSMIITGNESIYDRLAGTRVERI